MLSYIATHLFSKTVSRCNINSPFSPINCNFFYNSLLKQTEVSSHSFQNSPLDVASVQLHTPKRRGGGRDECASESENSRLSTARPLPAVNSRLVPDILGQKRFLAKLEAERNSTGKSGTNTR